MKKEKLFSKKEIILIALVLIIISLICIWAWYEFDCYNALNSFSIWGWILGDTQREYPEIKCNEKYSGLTCYSYNKGLISLQGYIELIELSKYNADNVIHIMDECITKFSGRNDTINVCNEIFNESYENDNESYENDIYYFRVYRSDTNETLDEFWASDISIGIKQMDMARRFYIQNTPNVKTEYYLSELPNPRTNENE